MTVGFRHGRDCSFGVIGGELSGWSTADRRRQAAVAGHRGDSEEARRLSADVDPQVRQLALRGLERAGDLLPAELEAAMADPDPVVRRRAAALAAAHPEVAIAIVLGDPDDRVVEMAAWAAGERPYERGDHLQLASIASDHRDSLCREAAVASLGAIAHPDGLAVILAALADRTTIRRRAVVALAPFRHPDVDAALRAALDDRDWQVRQVAEDLLAQD